MFGLFGKNKDIKIFNNYSSGCSPSLRWGTGNGNLVGVFGGVPVYTMPINDWDSKKQESRPMEGVGLDIGVAVEEATRLFRGLQPQYQKNQQALMDAFSYRTYAYCHPDWFAKVDKQALAEALEKAVAKLDKT